MMKATTTLALTLATIATAAARLPLGGDFDGDGTPDAAFYDADSATIEIGYNIGAPLPDWRTSDVRRHGYFDGRFLRAADLNTDGRTDLYVASRDANRVLVLWGDANRATGFTPSEFIIGAGPAFADLVPDTASLAVPLIASATPSWYRFLPEKPNQNPLEVPIGTAYADAQWSDFRAGREALGAIINAAAFAAARSTSSGELLVFQKRPLDVLSRAGVGLPAELDRLTSFGFFAGSGNPPATVAFGIGASEIVVVGVLAGAGANPPALAATHHQVGAIAEARTISTAVGDRLLLVAADGSSATVHEIDGANLNLEQTLNPPLGSSFLAFAQTASGELVAALVGGLGFAVYTDSGAGFSLSRDGAIPPPPAPGSGTQLVLYDKHPYGARPALPIESLPAGDWGSAPSLAGTTISATLETLLNPLTGLGNPLPLNLDAGVTVPGEATVFANQFQDDTSTDYAGGPASDGVAAVLVAPPGGSYASTIELGFLAAPGTTVHYRLGDAPWQMIANSETLVVDQSARFQYYGSNGVALSAIRAEDYLITQDPDVDTDGDKVPDAIEKAFGLSPFAGSDSDGDGHSDFSEIVAQTDPGNPADHPAEELKLDAVRLAVSIEAVRPNGVTAPPAIGTEVFVRSLDGGLIAANTTAAVSAPQIEFELDLPTRFVVIETTEVFPLSGLFIQLWPHGRRLSALVEIPPRPTPTGPVNPASNDMVGDWLAGVNAAIASTQAEEIPVLLDPSSTLAALAFEAWPTKWKGFSLDGKGTEIIDEPRPGVITLLTEEVIDTIEAVEEDGDRFQLSAVWAALQTALAEPASAPLLAATRDIYATSAGSAPTNNPPPAPIATLRGFFEDGTVPPAYAADLNPPLVLGNLWNAVVDSPLPDTVINASGLLATAGTDCLVLIESGMPGTRYELVDSAALPFWQTENAPIIDGASATLVGFLRPEITPLCGDAVVEVISLQVNSVPLELVNDADGDALPDDLELLLLGMLGSGFWDDPDNDGYTTGEELYLDPLHPSDPAEGASFPAGPPAFPSGIETLGGSNVTLTWDGNGAAVYSVESATGLDGDWQPTGIAPVETPPGHYTWEDPEPIDEEQRKFYQITVALEP